MVIATSGQNLISCLVRGALHGFAGERGGVVVHALFLARLGESASRVFLGAWLWACGLSSVFDADFAVASIGTCVMPDTYKLSQVSVECRIDAVQ